MAFYECFEYFVVEQVLCMIQSIVHLNKMVDITFGFQSIESIPEASKMNFNPHSDSVK